MSTDATAYRLGIAEEIRVLLARRRVSATQLARQLDWSQTYMARRMVGAQPWNVDDLEAIAKALDVSIPDLLPSRTGRVTEKYSPDAVSVTRVGSLEPATALAARAGVALAPIQRTAPASRTRTERVSR